MTTQTFVKKVKFSRWAFSGNSRRRRRSEVQGCVGCELLSLNFTKFLVPTFPPMIFLISPLLLLLLLFLFPDQTRSKRPSSHPHQGLLSPYTPDSFESSPPLTPSDEKALAKGLNVMKQLPAIDGGAGGRAICVQDINAPTTHIWNQILDLNNYVGKVPKLKKCENYEVNDNDDGTKTIKTRMVVGVLPGYSYEYFINHKYHKQKNSLLWSLDYNKYNDFDDVQGHWKVSPHPSKSQWTRVYYAADLKMMGKVPKTVMNILSKKALGEATGWVKRESEKAFGKAPDAAPFFGEFA